MYIEACIDVPEVYLLNVEARVYEVWVTVWFVHIEYDHQPCLQVVINFKCYLSPKCRWWTTDITNHILKFHLFGDLVKKIAYL